MVYINQKHFTLITFFYSTLSLPQVTIAATQEVSQLPSGDSLHVPVKQARDIMTYD